MKSRGRLVQLLIRATWHVAFHPHGDSMVATAPASRLHLGEKTGWKRVPLANCLLLLGTRNRLLLRFYSPEPWSMDICDFKGGREVYLARHGRVLNRIGVMFTRKKGVRVSAFTANRVCHMLHQMCFCCRSYSIIFTLAINALVLFFFLLKFRSVLILLQSAFCRIQFYTADNPDSKWTKDIGWTKCFLETILPNCTSFSTIELFNQTFAIYMQILLIFY